MLKSPGRRLPIPEDIRDFLGDLLGVPVAVDKRPVVSDARLPADRRWVTGRYIDDDDQLVGACIADLPLATSAGAALAMMPATAAIECIASGRLDGPLREHFHEVLSVVSAMLNVLSDPHLRLADVVDGVPDDVVGLLETASALKHYDVAIVGQTGGTLALVGV